MKFYRVVVRQLVAEGGEVVRYVWASNARRAKDICLAEERQGRCANYHTIEFDTSKDELLWVLNHFASAPEKAIPDVPGMVNRFLSWPLPTDFRPDCGISFDGAGKTPEEYVDGAGYRRSWPVGTNLLTAEQARAMIEHMLKD